MTSEHIETVSFVVLAALCTLLELVKPLVAVGRRRYLKLDLLGGGIGLLAVVLSRSSIKAACVGLGLESALAIGFLARLPSVIKVPLLLLSMDLCLYWIHRLMHTSPLWRTHVLHHTPQAMYWLAGLRTSAVHSFFFTLPQVLLPFTIFAASQLEAGLAISGVIFAQLFIHSNTDISLGGLGRWLLVTPRTHRIHHGYGTVRDRNFGSVFILWDRLFGTFHAPELIPPGYSLGLGDSSAREARRARSLLGA